MAKYQITGPDGSKYEVTAPDTASDAEVMQVFQSQMAPPATNSNDVNVAADAVQSAGSGLVRGAIGLAGLPALAEQGGRYAVNAIGRQFGAKETVSPETALPGFNDMKGVVERNFGKLYEPKTTVGEFARTVGEFAPGMLFPGGAATALGRLGVNVIAPALASETAGQLTKGTQVEPYARLAGGLAGGFGPQMIRRAGTPLPISPERANAVRTLENEGINLTAGQATGRKPLRWAESVTQDTIGAGRRAAQIAEQQKEQFTSAALRRAGINARRASQDVMDEAFTNIGREFDQMTNQAIIAPAALPPARRQFLQDRLRQLVDHYNSVTPEAMRVPMIGNLSDEINRLFANNTSMHGQSYQGYRSQIDRAARNMGEPNAKQALYDVRNFLDDLAMASNRNPQWRQEFTDLRRRYRNLLVIERAAAGGGENAATGLISPSQLKSAAKGMNRRDYVRGRNDYAQLAEAGRAIMSELPQSGTAPRAGAAHLMQLLGFGFGGAMGDFTGAIGGVLAPALSGRALMSNPVQTYLRNQAYNIPLPTGSRIAATPGSVISLQEQDRKKR